MTRVYLLVEGQTEEAFVNELLKPHYAPIGLYLIPIIVQTSAGFRGGMTSYSKIRPQITRLCRGHRNEYVSTLFDLYALPKDFPGKGSPSFHASLDGNSKAAFLEAQLTEDLKEENFIPNLLVHEFEALLFTRIDAFTQWIDDDDMLAPLLEIQNTTQPEEVNDGPTTAPSKRILAAMPNYQKTVHGPIIACDIGLDAIRASCPHFDGWLKKIEELMRAPPILPIT